jgi:hypothetical protein
MDTSTPSRALALGRLGLFVAVVMPLLPSATDAPAITGLVCVALAVLAIASLGGSRTPLSATPLLQRAAGSVHADPHSGGQITDPTHHPLRPRAPGRV